jgi:hypothetical protein
MYVCMLCVVLHCMPYARAVLVLIQRIAVAHVLICRPIIPYIIQGVLIVVVDNR